MLELLLGQIPEAIFFALFMIYAKNLKEKRVLFILLMIAEYILLTRFIQFNIWLQISYIFITYLILKLLYKGKAQIIDIFTFAIASLIIVICSLFSYLLILSTIKNFLIANLIQKILLFVFIFLFKNKLYKIQNIYKKFWNRNDKIKKNMKSTTFRALNLFLFNILFCIINTILVFFINNWL